MIVLNNLDTTRELKNQLEITADYNKYLST